MTGWIRMGFFVVGIAQAGQAIAQSAASPETAALPRERRLEYALRIAMAEREFTHNNVERARTLLESCPQDLRRWEWHYLRRLCNSELKSLPMPEWTNEVLLGPDGRHFAVIGRRRINMRFRTGNKSLFDMNCIVQAAAFAPDGRKLVVGQVGSVSLFDATNGKRRKRIDIPRLREDRIHGVGLSHDGKRLGVVQFYIEEGTRRRASELSIWDVSSGKHVTTFGELPASTTQVRFSPDGKLVATGSAGMGAENPHWPGEVRIWDLETRKRLHKLQTYDPDELPDDDSYFLTDFAFSPDGTQVVVASYGGRMILWDVHSGRKIHTLNQHTGTVSSVAFDGSGRRIVSGGADRIVRIWDVTTGAVINSMRGHNNPVQSVAFLDARRVASVGKSMRIWDTGVSQPARTFQGHHRGSVVFGIAFDPNSNLLGTASMHVARIRDIKHGRLRSYEVETRSNRPGPGIAFSADGQLFGTTDRGGAKLWNVETGELVHTLPDGEKSFFGTIFGIAFDPSGPLVAISGQDQLAIWNQKTGKLVHKIKLERGASRCVVFRPDGKLVATGHYGQKSTKDKVTPGQINLWDVETGKLNRTITASGAGSMRLSYDPDGRRIAATTDKTVTVFDTGNGDQLLELRGHSATVNGVAFSPEGDRIATGSDDHTVRIWDADSGQELLSLPYHKAPVMRVAFSPNGMHLASSSAGPNTVKVWDATPPGQLGVQAPQEDKERELAKKPIPKFPDRIEPVRSTKTQQDAPITPMNVSDIGVINEVELPDSRAPNLIFGPTAGEIAVLQFQQPMMVLDERELGPTRDIVAELRPSHFAATTDGRLVAWSDDSRTIIQRMADGRQIVVDSKYRHALLAFRPDGKFLATGGQGSRARIWDTESGDLRFVLDTEGRGTIEPLFSPDGKRIAVRNFRTRTRIFDAATGDLLHILPDLRLSALVFRPDSQVLAASNSDGQLRLWDLSNGQPLESAKAPVGGPIEWDPTGRLLVVGGRGLEFRDAETLKLLHAMPELGPVLRVRWTSDGSRLLCASLVRAGRQRIAKVLLLSVPAR